MSANRVPLYCLDCGTGLPPLAGAAVECPRRGRPLIGKSLRSVPGLLNRMWGFLVNSHEAMVYSSGAPSPRAADRIVAAGCGVAR